MDKRLSANFSFQWRTALRGFCIADSGTRAAHAAQSARRSPHSASPGPIKSIPLWRLPPDTLRNAACAAINAVARPVCLLVSSETGSLSRSAACTQATSMRRAWVPRSGMQPQVAIHGHQTQEAAAAELKSRASLVDYSRS